MDFFDFLKSNKMIILAVSIIMNLLLAVTSGFFFYKYKNFERVEEIDSSIAVNTVVEEENDIFYVEIKGAVSNPGVYEAKSGNIINDIVEFAGGFTKKAYTKNINLSRKVTSELVIYVYTESEYKEANKSVAQTICECPTYNISNCTDNKVSEIVPSNKDESSNSTEIIEDTNNNNEFVSEENTQLVNINTASKDELMNLSGIGESKADDIIEYRNSYGNFKTIEEIKNVSGIGDALFNKIKESITV